MTQTGIPARRKVAPRNPPAPAGGSVTSIVARTSSAAIIWGMAVQSSPIAPGSSAASGTLLGTRRAPRTPAASLRADSHLRWGALGQSCEVPKGAPGAPARFDI